MVYRSAASTANEYVDVDAGAYYAPYVAWGTQIGMLNGFGDGSFDPATNITRAEMAVIIGRLD